MITTHFGRILDKIIFFVILSWTNTFRDIFFKKMSFFPPRIYCEANRCLRLVGEAAASPTQIYIYIYICVYIHIYIYIYIFEWGRLPPPPQALNSGWLHNKFLVEKTTFFWKKCHEMYLFMTKWQKIWFCLEFVQNG